jgi:His/Glu/Gln/Arg/opine family amino acid ABC transporter permease subunit
MIPWLDDFVALSRPLIVINCVLTVTAIAIALPIACLVAAGRLSRRRAIRAPTTAYVNVLRSSPLVMIMFWAYTIGPMVTGHPNSAYVSALAALAAFEVAYFAEIVRAGLQSVAIGQRNAALASGLTAGQTLRLVLLPQALRRMIPSLLTQSLIAFQDSTIASIISVPDVMQTTNVINAREQDPVTLYAMLAVMFFVICYSLSHAIRRLERRSLRRTALAVG